GVIRDFLQAIVGDVGDDDVQRGRRVDVDIVDAEPEPADHLAALKLPQQFARQLGIGDEDAVSIARNREYVGLAGTFGNADFRIEPFERGHGRLERGKHAVGNRDQWPRHGNTCGLTQFGGRLPSRKARMLSTTLLAMPSRTSTVALPICGVSTTLASARRSLPTFGSCSNTSRRAPAICFRASARVRATSSTIGPRAVLIKYAVGFISRNSRAPI